MRIHYLQHVPFENPGSILLWGEQNGHTFTCTHLYKNEKLPKEEDFDWLIIMGGPMNIYEDVLYPWLKKEKAFIKTAIEAKKVVLGICLGAQLIADVIGGKVTKNPKKEIGWFEIEFKNEAHNLPLFSFFPKKATVFHWHGDTFSLLPKNALVLASSKGCANQAFMYEKRVFGFQFHIESTKENIDSLIKYCADELIEDEFVQTPKEITKHLDYTLTCKEWMDTFLSMLENAYNKDFNK
ncbi:MAG: type 1 glutamine amidotransferase [Campylobacteraceae bacterium]